MNQKKTLVSILISLAAMIGRGQYLSLEEAILLSGTHSVAARLYQNILLNKRYEYQMYVAGQKPQLRFQALLPQYSKDYLEVRQPDGGLLFLPRIQNAWLASVSLSQVIPRSGGQITLSTRLTRFEDYDLGAATYNSTPLGLSYEQPLGGFNPYKWERLSQPLRLKEAEKNYKDQMEELALQTVGYFFDLLEAQEQVRIAAASLGYNQQIQQLETQRIENGSTSREVILRMELQVLRSLQAAQEAEAVLRQTRLRFFNHLGITPDSILRCILPDPATIPVISEVFAQAQAYQNRPEYVKARLQETEEARDIDKAKHSNTPIQLLVSVGFNGAGSFGESVFRNIRDQQGLSIAAGLPIMDWGRRKAEIALAAAREKVGAYTRKQEENQIQTTISNQVQNLALYQAQAEISRTYKVMAAERHSIAMEQYHRGGLSLTELMLALQEKEEAQRMETHYIRQLWETYYQLRRLTLYDYVAEKKL